MTHARVAIGRRRTHRWRADLFAAALARTRRNCADGSGAALAYATLLVLVPFGLAAEVSLGATPLGIELRTPSFGLLVLALLMAGSYAAARLAAALELVFETTAAHALSAPRWIAGALGWFGLASGMLLLVHPRGLEPAMLALGFVALSTSFAFGLRALAPTRTALADVLQASFVTSVPIAGALVLVRVLGPIGSDGALALAIALLAPLGVAHAWLFGASVVAELRMRRSEAAREQEELEALSALVD